MKDIDNIVTAPINEGLTPHARLEHSIQLSELITKMVTHVICHAIVDYADLLKDERLSVANAFLQRVTSTHLCNHKLTLEGITCQYNGEAFPLHEEFKTMTLTRSVYEHLVMFYFIYIHPKTDEQRCVVWNYWKINSKKNLLDYDEDGLPGKEQEGIIMEIEALRKELFATATGRMCRLKLDEWTAIGKPTQNGCIAFSRRQGRLDVRKVSYNQAWKYLFKKEDMTLLYRHLSMHSHPIYNGLLQYQSQSQKDEGFDGVPLYLSSSFLASLCRLFLRFLPDGDKLMEQAFTRQELSVFNALSRM